MVNGTLVPDIMKQRPRRLKSLKNQGDCPIWIHVQIVIILVEYSWESVSHSDLHMGTYRPQKIYDLQPNESLLSKSQGPRISHHTNDKEPIAEAT